MATKSAARLAEESGYCLCGCGKAVEQDVGFDPDKPNNGVPRRYYADGYCAGRALAKRLGYTSSLGTAEEAKAKREHVKQERTTRMKKLYADRVERGENPLRPRERVHVIEELPAIGSEVKYAPGTGRAVDWLKPGDTGKVIGHFRRPGGTLAVRVLFTRPNKQTLLAPVRLAALGKVSPAPDDKRKAALAAMAEDNKKLNAALFGAFREPKEKAKPAAKKAAKKKGGQAMKIVVEEVAYHRNGIGGIGFHVVTFRWAEDGDEPRPMVGVVFPDEATVAVFDRVQLFQGNITFANGNSWRGDHFESALRNAVAEYETQQEAHWKGAK